MIKISSILALIVTIALLAFSTAAQETPGITVLSLSQVLPGLPDAGKLDFDPHTGTWTGTNGVYASNGNTTLTADWATLNQRTGEVSAEGHVKITSGGRVWMGEHITYNFKTRQMRAEQYRTGKFPVFAEGSNLTGDGTNKIYSAVNAAVTTDDYFNPDFKIKASRINIVPEKYVEMWNAVAWAKGVPIFYFPYYKRNLGEHANNFTFTPGYRSSYGAFLLGEYQWFAAGTNLDGTIHVDYRSLRGPGIGPDVNLHLGRWGDMSAQYYYTYDVNAGRDIEGDTNFFQLYGNTPKNRQRFNYTWQATPETNLNLKAQVNYQSDPLVLRDFFSGEYSENPQPNTFIEAQKYSDNWSLDAFATPRVNSFFNQIERLPDVKLTGYRQQIFNTPLYYDSESSLGWYRSYAANLTNGIFPSQDGFYTNQAMRADTYHQITLPWTFFHWLNVAPRIGGRFDYYSERPWNENESGDVARGALNTGMEVSFKASALWTDTKSSLLDVDGIRHVIEPSINYAYITPFGTKPNTVPQFDGQLPALLISPITYPDNNSIDAVSTQNVIRFGLRNLLQTKREGQISELVNWNLMLDWHIDHNYFANFTNNPSNLGDLYSQFAIHPRDWLSLESQIRYDLNDEHLNLAFHQLVFTPGDRWSWGIGHLYLHDGMWGNGTWARNDFLVSTLFYRINDNWGIRAQHYFNIETGYLQQQAYSLYRDLRSVTCALTFRVENQQGGDPDYTVAFQLSFKSMPRHLGADAVSSYDLVGE
jgi:LPS-assembly protein